MFERLFSSLMWPHYGEVHLVALKLFNWNQKNLSTEGPFGFTPNPYDITAKKPVVGLSKNVTK